MFDILGPGSLELFPCSTDVLGTICTYVTPYLSRSEPASKLFCEKNCDYFQTELLARGI